MWKGNRHDHWLRKPLVHFLSEVHLLPKPHPAQYFSTRWKQNTYTRHHARYVSHRAHVRGFGRQCRDVVLVQVPEQGGRIWECPAAALPRSHNAYCVKRTLYQICFVHTHSPILAATHTLYWCIPLVHTTGTYHWCIPLVSHTSLQHFKRASHVLQTGIIPRRPQPGQNCP